MARRPLTGEVKVITSKVGQVTEGIYIGSRSVDTGKDQPQIAHALEAKDGEVFEVWGSAQINNALGRVEKGTYIWITYQGKKPSRRGEMHDFLIEYDDDLKFETQNEPLPPKDAMPEKGAGTLDPDEIPF